MLMAQDRCFHGVSRFCDFCAIAAHCVALCGKIGDSPCAVGLTGSTGLLICLSVRMPEDAFADLRSDSWGTSQILPQVWCLTVVQQLQVPFQERKIQQLSLSVFDEKLQVMCNKFSQ